MRTNNFGFYLQNILIQTSQTGGQRYNETSPFSIPWPSLIFVSKARSRSLKYILGVNVPTLDECEKYLLLQNGLAYCSFSFNTQIRVSYFIEYSVHVYFTILPEYLVYEHGF